MCVARSPFPPSLAPVLLSVPFGHCWLNWLFGLSSNRISGGQVGSVPIWVGNFPNLKTSWWRSQLTFLALGRFDLFKPPLGIFNPEKMTLGYIFVLTAPLSPFSVLNRKRKSHLLIQRSIFRTEKNKTLTILIGRWQFSPQNTSCRPQAASHLNICVWNWKINPNDLDMCIAFVWSFMLPSWRQDVSARWLHLPSAWRYLKLECVL